MYIHKSKIYSVVCSVMAASAFLVSCTDEAIRETPETLPQYENLVTVEVPAKMTFGLYSGNPVSTRDGEGGNGSSSVFDDGLSTEYAFAPGKDHHFVLIYPKDQNTAQPSVIFDVDLANADIEMNSADYITLDAKTAVIRDEMKPIWGHTMIKSLLQNAEAYVVVNFDRNLIYNPQSYPNISLNKSNVETLYSLTRSQFLSLQLSDYKISVSGRNYFTMSNTVYLGSDNNLKADYTINPNNVYEEKEVIPAGAEPAVVAHLERLAVKYTLTFSPSDYFTQNQTSEESDQIANNGEAIPVGTYNGYYAWDSDRNLPIYAITINQYTGISIGQGYSVNSTPVEALVHVLGYAVNNQEPSSRIIKNITTTQGLNLLRNGIWKTGSWNDAAHFRCYWSEDPNYQLQKDASTASAKGYPHQFRKALETDTVLQYHGGKYNYPGYTDDSYISQVEHNGNTLTFYESLGEEDYTSVNPNCVLKYLSFKNMEDTYSQSLREYNASLTSSGAAQGSGGCPIYSLENTYYDPGMTAGSAFAWEWLKAPYSAANNITLLCQLSVTDHGINSSKTVYRGQNNVFYFDENELLASKLEIFNKVILSAGNAGLHIHHMRLASHGNDDSGEDSFHDTAQDKVAWNRGSVLWVGKVDGTGEVVEQWEAKAGDLRLIPAEISGGDGQCLIAPQEMGKDYRFFLAPVNVDGNNNPIDYDGNPVTKEEDYVRNKDLSVEISFNHLVALIHKVIGPIDVFTDGYMYYSIPVPHRIENLNPMTGTNPVWKTLGNIGTVRNNWYIINVANVTNVGTPVHNINQPIVPVMDVVRSYINANIQIYGWHTLRQDGIPL